MQCWRVSPGTTIVDRSTMYKTIRLMRGDGTFDTSTATGSPTLGSGSATYPISIHTVATVSGTSGFYTAWGGGWSNENAGYFYVPYGAITSAGGSSVAISGPGASDARCVGIYGSTLYGTDSPLESGWTAVFRLGSTGSLPTGTASE